MSFADEDRAGRNSIYRAQECQGAFLKLEGCGIPNQGVIFEAKRLAETDLAKLPVDRIGIGKGETLTCNRDAHARFGDGERELQLDRTLQIHTLYQRLETIPCHPH